MNIDSSKCIQADNFAVMQLEYLIAKSGKTPNLSLYIGGTPLFYCILTFEQDTTHKVDSNKYFVKKGECLFVMPGSTQEFDKEIEYRGIISIFTESFIFRYGSKSTSNLICERRKRVINMAVIYNNPNNSDIINFIFRYSEIGGNYRDSRIGTMFVSYILKMFEANVTDKYLNHLISKNKIFMAFNQLLIDRKIESRDAKDYAKEMGISYGILNRACKNSVNLTPKNCIDYVLTIEAKQQLFTTSKSIKEISFYLNFDGTSNFSKYFKKQTGMLPLQYKEMIYQCSSLSSL